MSDFAVFVDALIEDLVDNVPTLAVEPENIHRYDPASPEELLNDGGRHLAVWPAAEAGEAASPLTLGADEILQVYRLIYWEPSASERGITDQEAAQVLLDLANAVRARFYRAAFAVTGFWKIRYRGIQFPERSSQVRWFLMEIEAFTGIAYT
jgi:hypothetical protein